MDNQISTQPEWPQIEQRKRHVWWTLLAIGVLILMGVVVFFVARQEKVEAAPGELKINIAFASFIDDDFNYALQPSAEYIQDEGIYLYAEAMNFRQGKELNVDLSEDLEIKDSGGNPVFAKKNFGVLKEKYSEEMGVVKFSNVVPTLNWKPGIYYATVVVNDNLAGKSAEKTMEFSIKEKSKEVSEKTADIKSIVSNIAGARLLKQQTVFDPSGKLIPELSFNQTITQDLTGLNLSNIDASFKIPERFAAGVYTIEIKYTNLDNWQMTIARDTITVVKQLAIDQLVFAGSIDDDYLYEIQPNAVYPVGAEVFVYIRLVDFAQLNINNKFMVNFTEDAAVLDENNNVIISQKDYIKANDLNDDERDSYNIKNSFATAGFKPGKYTYRAAIKDINNGQQTTKEAGFWLE